MPPCRSSVPGETREMRTSRDAQTDCSNPGGCMGDQGLTCVFCASAARPVFMLAVLTRDRQLKSGRQDSRCEAGLENERVWFVSWRPHSLGIAGEKWRRSLHASPSHAESFRTRRIVTRRQSKYATANLARIASVDLLPYIQVARCEAIHRGYRCLAAQVSYAISLGLFRCFLML